MLEIKYQVLDKNKTSGYVLLDVTKGRLHYVERNDMVKLVKKGEVNGVKYKADSDTFVGVNGFKMSSKPRITKTKGLKGLGITTGDSTNVQNVNNEQKKLPEKEVVRNDKLVEKKVKRNLRVGKKIDKNTIKIIKIVKKNDDHMVEVELHNESKVLGRMCLIKSSLKEGDKAVVKKKELEEHTIVFAPVNVIITLIKISKNITKVMIEDELVDKCKGELKNSLDALLKLFEE